MQGGGDQGHAPCRGTPDKLAGDLWPCMKCMVTPCAHAPTRIPLLLELPPCTPCCIIAAAAPAHAAAQEVFPRPFRAPSAQSPNEASEREVLAGRPSAGCWSCDLRAATTASHGDDRTVQAVPLAKGLHPGAIACVTACMHAAAVVAAAPCLPWRQRVRRGDGQSEHWWRLLLLVAPTAKIKVRRCAGGRTSECKRERTLFSAAPTSTHRRRSILLRESTAVGKQKEKANGRRGCPLQGAQRRQPGPWIQRGLVGMSRLHAERDCMHACMHLSRGAYSTSSPPMIISRLCTEIWDAAGSAPVTYTPCAPAARSPRALPRTGTPPQTQRRPHPRRAHPLPLHHATAIAAPRLQPPLHAPATPTTSPARCAACAPLCARCPSARPPRSARCSV